jgi:DNA-binding transcriptional LysR family regulator
MAFTPLNALNQFLAVARRRSFAAAASELGISSSALSQSVRQLEERLGVTLLSRTTRSVALTESGRRLLEQAGPALTQALEALKATSAQKGQVTGKVRLTVPTIAVQTIMRPLIPRFIERYPQVEVEVQVDNRLVNIVEQGFDAGIRLDDTLERDMVHLRLTEASRFVVVGAPSYLERHGVPKRPKDLLSHDCLCFRSATTGSLYAWELEPGKKTWRIPVRGTFTSNNDRLMVDMAEAGLGLLYSFEPAVAPQLKRGSLRVVLEPFAAKVAGFFLYFPSRTQVSPAFRAFVDMAREVMTASRSGHPGAPSR